MLVYLLSATSSKVASFGFSLFILCCTDALMWATLNFSDIFVSVAF